MKIITTLYPAPTLWMVKFDGVMTEEGLLEVLHSYRQGAKKQATHVGLGPRHAHEWVRFVLKQTRGNVSLDATADRIVREGATLVHYAKGQAVRLEVVPMLPPSFMLIHHKAARRELRLRSK